MMIDILIIVILIALAIYGYLKGFVVGLVNLVIGAIYLYFSTDILNVGMNAIDDNQLSNDLYDSVLMKYVVIILVGMIIILIVNIILRKIIRSSVVSKFDRLGGIIIYVTVGYLLLCIVSVIYSNLNPFVDFPDSLSSSFFLSTQFHEYNILYWWWSNGR